MGGIVEKVDIIGVQMDLGASRRGVNMGPLAIRYSDICRKMSELGISWRDKGDIIPRLDTETVCDNFRQITDANRRLFEAVSASLREGCMPVVLGGDHSIAAGSIPAVAAADPGVGIIWIDAHGDFNNMESSATGNIHGMPFSAVCGLGPSGLADFAEPPVYVDPRRCVQIGARDIDPPERIRMREAGVTVFSMTEIDKLGMTEVLERAIRIASSGSGKIHVSFDIDAVTPQEAPGVGTPVHSGLTVREAFLAAEMLAESGRVISLDMVEVNPILDEKNKTAQLACELILSLLGKIVY